MSEVESIVGWDCSWVMALVDLAGVSLAVSLSKSEYLVNTNAQAGMIVRGTSVVEVVRI